jgi:hypothetical protein
MARVTVQTVTKPETVYNETQEFTLVLSDMEATVLRTILSRVGGDRYTSNRIYMNDLTTALNAAGKGLDDCVEASGSIYFDEVGRL